MIRILAHTVSFQDKAGAFETESPYKFLVLLWKYNMDNSGTKLFWKHGMIIF